MEIFLASCALGGRVAPDLQFKAVPGRRDRFLERGDALVIVFEHEDGFPQKSFVWVSPLRRKVIDRCGNASGDDLLLDDFPDYFPLAAGKATADARHVDGCA